MDLINTIIEITKNTPPKKTITIKYDDLDNLYKELYNIQYGDLENTIELLENPLNTIEKRLDI